jgi:hypothetical protein
MTRRLCTVLALFAYMACGPSQEEAAEPWTPPPYWYGPLEPAQHVRVCAESGMALSDFECTEDADCRFCHDGSGCGSPMNLEELRRRGAACQQPPSETCEASAPRCCEGRCTTVGY